MSVEFSTLQSATSDSLIERCLKRDQQAWEQIVRQHRRKVYNVAYRFVGRHEEAEDLTQEIFLRLFKALPTFDRRANFQTWLISISRNLCIDHYRRVRAERQRIDRNVVDAGELTPDSSDKGPHVILERSDGLALLRRALQAMPPVLRTAVLLRDIQELSYHEIARQLRLPEGTVKSRINRGRIDLARQIVRLQNHQPSARRRVGSSSRVRGRHTGVAE